MRKIIVAVAIAMSCAIATSSASQAFWQRSQVSRCSDATSEAERLQLRCWELEPFLDPGGAAIGWGGVYGVPFNGRPGVQRFKGGPVTRRLG